MPLTQCTRGVYFINTCEPDKRIHILKPKTVLLSLPKDSTDIMCEGKIEQYKNRPVELANISLAEFCSCYDIQYRKSYMKRRLMKPTIQLKTSLIVFVLILVMESILLGVKSPKF